MCQVEALGMDSLITVSPAPEALYLDSRTLINTEEELFAGLGTSWRCPVIIGSDITVASLNGLHGGKQALASRPFFLFSSFFLLQRTSYCYTFTDHRLL